MQQKVIKGIAILLITIFFVINTGTLASYAVEEIMTANELENQGVKTNSKDVEFDICYENNKHVQILDISSEGVKINLKVKVKGTGYLSNILVDFSDANFTILENSDNEENIQLIDTQKNMVTIRQINGGEELVIPLTIVAKKADVITQDLFNKYNKINLTATYINEKEKETNVVASKIINTQWDSEATVQLFQHVTKYKPYNIENNIGVLLETVVDTSIKDNILPVKTTKIEIKVPRLNNEKPKKVKVIANKTLSTNGKSNGVDFNQDNWKYNEETEVIEINTNNNLDEISWLKNAIDEYKIIYIYSEEVATQLYDNTTVNLKSNVFNELYSNNNKNVSTEISEEFVLENIGEIVDLNANIVEESIEKGYVYNNKIANDENKLETQFNINYTINVSNADIVDSIIINEKLNEFKDVQGINKFGVRNDIYSKKLTVNKIAYDKMFGDDGYINIKNQDNVIIATINKNSQIDENGNIIIEIENSDINYLTIETSAPKQEENLEINVLKAIKKDIELTKTQMEKVEQLNIEYNASVKKGEVLVSSLELTDTAALTEPTSKVSLDISDADLSTVVKNENIEIRAVLESDSIDDLLYKNPKININLPEYITDVNLKVVQALYNDELKIKSYDVINNGNAKTIAIELEGTQTKYTQTSIAKGITIVINTDLTVEKLTPSKDSEITMIYSNENDLENRTISKNIKFIAPNGVVAINTAENYSENEQKLTVMNGETAKGTLDTYAQNKTIGIKEEIINNYNNEINNVSILGKIPTEEQVKIDSTANYGNTFNTSLTGPINLNYDDATIYYSANTSVNNDLTNANNGWTTMVTDYSEVKSYLVALNSQLKTGENLQLEYNLDVPDNLTHNNQITTDYKVYYNNESPVGNIPETVASPNIELGTGEGVELEAELSSNIEKGSVVKTGQIIRMNVTVKNTGSIKAENIQAIINAPEGTKFAEYDEFYKNYTILNETTKTIEIGNLETGKSISVEYILKILIPDDDEEENTQKITQIINSVEIKEKTITMNTNEYSFAVEDGKMFIINKVDINEENTIKSGTTVEYNIAILNITEKRLNNVIIYPNLPADITITKLSISDYGIISEIDINNIDQVNVNTTGINIGSIQSNLQKNLIIQFTVGEDTQNKFSTGVKAKADNTDIHYSDTRYINKGTATVTANAVEPDDQYVKEGEAFIYEFNVNINGTAPISNFKFEDQLSDRLEFLKVEVIVTEGVNHSTAYHNIDNNLLTVKMNSVDPNSVVNIKIYVKCDLNNQEEDNLEIKNTGKVNIDTFNEISINSESYFIQYSAANSSNNNNNNNDNQKQGRYIITGTAWNDSNKNGKRDIDEQKIPNMQIILINKENSSIVKDLDSNQDKITTTNELGEYTFSNLGLGNYIVVFMYNNKEYSLTQYQKEDVAKSVNSDAISMNIQWNGEIIRVAATDTLLISKENLRNIDIGLYVADTFDLKLDKYISKVTVTTGSTGTKTYSYENKKLAKVDIPSKDVNNSSLVIEYKIVVTNEGSLAGYAKNIVDYIPNDLKFASELNSDWYVSNNGNVYNNSLKEVKIQPGESKELTLIVTKKVDSESMGLTISNQAEIYEDYNEYGVTDIDSTPNNKVEKEDDISTANTVLAVKTGQTVIYITLIITVITILSIGIFELKTKVLKKDN